MDDVDEVRAALGYDRLNLIGASYGTRAELVFLRRHPDRVRTAVLEGTVPTFARPPLGFAQGTQRALDDLVANGLGDAACGAAFPNLKSERRRPWQMVLRLEDLGIEVQRRPALRRVPACPHRSPGCYPSGHASRSRGSKAAHDLRLGPLLKGAKR